ncbi:hypothetical protein Trydic_g3066 [Trypoxylus dichotomus]
MLNKIRAKQNLWIELLHKRNKVPVPMSDCVGEYQTTEDIVQHYEVCAYPGGQDDFFACHGQLLNGFIT